MRTTDNNAAIPHMHHTIPIWGFIQLQFLAAQLTAAGIQQSLKQVEK